MADEREIFTSTTKNDEEVKKLKNFQKFPLIDIITQSTLEEK